MTKKVIYYEFTNEYTIQIVRALEKNHSWKPVFISGYAADKAKQKFGEILNKDCVFQDAMKLRQAQFDYTNLGEPFPIDATILASLSQYELNLMGVLQDTTGWNYSFDERQRFYFDILKYWNTVIKKFKPDLIVFFTWPHTAACYPLYLLAKHHLGIPILFIDPTPMLDRGFHFIGNSLENLHAPFMKQYLSEQDFSDDQVVINYLNEIKSNKAKIPKHISSVYEKDKIVRSQYVSNLFRLIISTLIKGTGFKKGLYEFKKNKKPYTSIDSRMNNIENLYFWWKLRKKNIKLETIYKEYCATLNNDLNYIYFAAPYQPEAVSATNGGAYEDIFLVLDILSSCCPKDWGIIYKEHPATFLEHFKGSMKRNKYFYDRVSSYANVQIIDSSTNTFDLISKAKAVATIGGTVGWESIVRGVPAMVFGGVWYTGCKSIFKIKTYMDAKQAIDMIKVGYVPDQADIKRYTLAIRKVSDNEIIHDGFNEAIIGAEDPTAVMIHASERLAAAYNSFYSDY